MKGALASFGSSPSRAFRVSSSRSSLARSSAFRAPRSRPSSGIPSPIRTSSARRAARRSRSCSLRSRAATPRGLRSRGGVRAAPRRGHVRGGPLHRHAVPPRRDAPRQGREGRPEGRGGRIDGQGNRIGYGKGYYDRFLSSRKANYKIGLAYEIQVLNNIPNNELDVPVDIIVTEKRIIRI